MSERRPERHLEESVCAHIFTVSAAMVGACLTVIGLVNVVITTRQADTIADDLLALDALLFLVACLTAYWALRTRSEGRMHRVERLADWTFIIALIFMAFICAFITYAVSVF